MRRTNINISLTVYSNTQRTVIPPNYNRSVEATHYVDLIQFQRGDESVENVICLAGNYIALTRKFYFVQESTERMLDVLGANFPMESLLEILSIIKETISLNIQMESMTV
jgi:hypothetical protein